nr:hypothetical protein L203_06274 [Cryptococcus depauperatus CBS 7841]
MPPRRAAPVVSPARSTRSTNRGREDDAEYEGFEGENIASARILSKPMSKTSKAGNSIGFKDTSINIAAAFRAAQTGHLPPPSSLLPPQQPTNSYNNPMSSNSHSASTQLKSPHAMSPAEQLAQSARALSPVRFFLRPADEDGDEVNSFSSLATPNTSTSFSTNGDGDSYDYHQEEEFVKQARQTQNIKTKAHISASDIRKRRLKASEGDLPYRPAEEDNISLASDDSGGEGEGIVKSGALQGRANTRGKRVERGEGYLGMGLGIQPKRRKSRKSGTGTDDESEEGTPGPNRRWTPADSLYRHSPTPAQLLRALSPKPPERNSTGLSTLGTYQPRRRPSNLRVILTNILHGTVIGLQFIVELSIHLVCRFIISPARLLYGFSKKLICRLRGNWWKWIGFMFGLSLALRSLDNTWRSRGFFIAPKAPPATINELSGRLTSLESATATLSDLLRVFSESDRDIQKSAVLLNDKVQNIEHAVITERKKANAMKDEWTNEKGRILTDFNIFRKQIELLTSQVDRYPASVSSDMPDTRRMVALEKEISELKGRMGRVEQSVQAVLDDGRLVSVLERVLPPYMPVRKDERGELHVEPIFWAEMKKVMLGKGEIETIVKRLIGEAGNTTKKEKQPALTIDEKKVEEWMDKAFDKRVHQSHWVSKDLFTDMLNKKLQEFNQELHVRRQSSPSTVTIKSSKGDDLTSFFNSLIDTALLKYSKDTLARTDYALFTAGARVIPHLTSDTLTLRTASSLGKWAWGSKDVQGRPPATALHPDISVGSCWPFRGQEGSLGVMLVDRIVIGDVTIEHAPKDLAVDVTTAPRTIKVLGLVDYDAGKDKLADYWATVMNDSVSEEDKDYLPLGSFTYDPSAQSHIQTFPVPPDVVDLGISVGVVVFKIESNWGGDFTCLYRIRVHSQ